METAMGHLLSLRRLQEQQDMAHAAALMEQRLVNQQVAQRQEEATRGMAGMLGEIVTRIGRITGNTGVTNNTYYDNSGQALVVDARTQVVAPLICLGSVVGHIALQIELRKIGTQVKQA